MTFENFDQITGGIESIATVVALIVGAYWTYTRFILQRENCPLIEFLVDIEFIGKHRDGWIVELVAHVENKGKVQHRFSNFMFDLATLNHNDQVERKAEYGGQVYFPNKAVDGSWLPATAKYFFIDPGTKAKYSFITSVPSAAHFVMLHSRFDYLDGEHAHTAERTKKVPVT